MKKFERVLLKVSGESLAGANKTGIDFNRVLEICEEIKDVKEKTGAQIAIVVGGGNFWRGRCNQQMDRCTADHIGMLATTMNALALDDAFRQLGCPSRVQTGIEMRQISEFYIRKRADRHLAKDRIVIFGCGTGNPFFSTDTAAALRAAEIEADIMLKATMVDGVYDKDPHKYDDAVKYDEISFNEILSNSLAVMDSTAAAMCKDNEIPILVFDLSRPDNIYDACMGKEIGTLVK